MDEEDSEDAIRLRSARARCGWCWSTRASTPRSGRRSARLRRRSAAAARRCANWVRQAERDQGLRAGPTTEERERHQGAGAREPRAAPGQRDPAQGVGVFCAGGARPPVEAMIAFIDDHRGVYGVEPICRVLPIAPSTYHAHAARRADPGRLPPRARRDAALRERDPARVSRRTSGSTACARSGGSSAGRGSRWPAARWRA